jgi:hypothetical protein
VILRTAKFVVIAGAAALAVSGPVGALGAQTVTTPAAAGSAPRPMFAVIHHVATGAQIAASATPTWNFSYVYNAVTYTDQFVGRNPTTNKSTKVPIYIIPIQLTYKTTVANPSSVVSSTTASPIFAKLKYIEGSTNVGKTQYIDAYQRAALWGIVSSEPKYHVLLDAPVVEPVQDVTVPNADGSVATAFGVHAIIANINWFDPVVQGLMTSLAIPSNALPIFLITQAYLSNNSGTSGCCIGGYHSYGGGGSRPLQPYAEFSYIQLPGAFAQDVAALSHEIGEYVNDPFTDNTDVPPECTSNAIYEVGDPLETEANYGDYPYVLGGFTYHLQDLVFPEYFGAPTSTSVNGWSTFQDTTIGVCANGG